MGLTVHFTHRFYTGTGGLTSLVPAQFCVAINGHPYMTDDTAERGIRVQGLNVLREQADTSDTPGEQSLNPEDLWRRAHDTWHLGAGQAALDRPGSNPARFHASKGIDVWTPWQISLLPDAAQRRASANTNLIAVPVGSYLYLADGQTLRYSQDITTGSPTWTTVTGTPGSNITSLASDGRHLYAAYGANGLYRTVRGDATAGSYVSGNVDLVGYVNGRLMAANGGNLYNLTAGGTLPTPLLTHDITDWAWTAFSEGPGHIYCAGFSGEKSIIYRTNVKADGSGLSQPVPALTLPDGEIARAVTFYAGLLVIGTDKGVRVAQIRDSGDLDSGGFIPTAQAVRCMEPQDRFVWYGWTNYDATSTGLGRLDLRNFTDTLIPAFASDLMAPVQGTVTSVATFQNVRIFTVAGSGLYAETTNRVTAGTLDTGRITYGVPDDKVALYLDVRTRPLAGSYRLLLSTDEASYVDIGTVTVSGTTRPVSQMPCGEKRGESFRVRYELTRSATDTTTGPTVVRVTLRSYPAPTLGEVWEIPLLLHDVVVTHDDREQDVDVVAERAYLRSLRDTRARVTLQVGDEQIPAVVDNFTEELHHWSGSPPCGWNGTMTVRLKSLVG